MTQAGNVRKPKSKDRDGVYKRRGRWHFDFRDPVTNQWRSKKTGKTAYNEAKEFKRLYMDSLKGQYNPSNDRLRFADAADAYILQPRSLRSCRNGEIGERAVARDEEVVGPDCRS